MGKVKDYVCSIVGESFGPKTEEDAIDQLIRSHKDQYDIIHNGDNLQNNSHMRYRVVILIHNGIVYRSKLCDTIEECYRHHMGHVESYWIEAVR